MASKKFYILKRKVSIAFLFLFISILLMDCAREKNSFSVYKGREMSIYFDLFYDYTEADYFLFDDYYIVHMKNWNSPMLRNDSVFIYPRRFVYMEHPVTGDRRERTTNIQMAIGLSYGLMEINKKQRSLKDRYEIDTGPLLLTKGELRVKKEKGRKIIIKLPLDYPITIKVLEK